MTTGQSRPNAVRRLRLALLLGAALLASVTLVGIWLGLPWLAALGVGLVPMPPLGAVLVLGLASACLAVERRSAVPGLGTPELAALVVGGISLAFVLGHASDHVLPTESWLLRFWPRLQLSSVLTDLALVGAALSLLARRAASGGWWSRQLALLLALVPLLIGLVVLISYGAGAPLLYGSGFIPMSVPAALCALLLGAAQFLAAVGDAWLLAALRPGRPSVRPGLSPRVVAAYLCVALLLLAGGALLLRRQIQARRALAQEELTSIAALKATQLSAWFAERQGDAEVIVRSGLLQTQLHRYLTGSPLAPPERDLRDWMASIQEGFKYERVALFDAQGRSRISVPMVAAEDGGQEDAAEVQAALRAPGVVTRDLHRAPGRSAIHLALWIPIRLSGAGTAQGALLFMVDPRTHLYPMVHAWPTRSPSAETLLVRREGDQVLYLNELRHLSHTALNLRYDLAAHPGMPAVRAALGEEGLVEGVDYRGVPVVSVLRKVPGTAWCMVTKVDAAEIYGPLRQRVWLGGLALMGFVLLLGATLGMVLRHREAGLLRQQLTLTQRYEILLREASDIILLLDGQGRILEINEQALRQYGYTQAEFLNLDIYDLWVPDGPAQAQDYFQRILESGSICFESWHRRQDGSTFPVEISARAMELEGQPRVLSFVRDISERRKQERELQRMNRLYAALSQVNQAIVWSPDREALFAKLCEVMVEFGSFDMAWIGLDDSGLGRVRVVASYGDAHGYLDRIRVERGPTAHGSGPVGRAIREGSPCILNDFMGTPGTEPWREAARESGFRAVAAFPIRRDGQVIGALAVYSKEMNVFAAKEEALLVEAAMDISFALDHLALDDQRSSAEIALLESERQLREAQEAGGIGTYTWFIQEDTWTGSPYLSELFGIGPEHPRTLEGWVQVVAPDFRATMASYVAGIIERHEAFDLDYPILRAADGQRRWVHGRGEIHRDADDRPVAMVGVIQDITERKLAELELSSSEELFSKVFKACPEAISISRMADGAYIEVNDVFLEMMGLPREAVVGRTSSDLKVWVDPRDRAAYIDVLKTQGSIQHQEFQFRMRGGSLRDCLVSAECIQLDGQECSLNFIQDITERKRAEQALRKVSVAMEQSPLSIVITDPGGVIEYVNPTFTQVTGYTAQEVIGQNPRVLKSPRTSPEYYRALWETLGRGEVWVGEFENLRKGGEPFQERAIIAPVRDDDGALTGYIAVKEDITRLKQGEAERRSLEAQLHQSQKLESLGSLAGGVAHDMNNVLGAILGLASTLRETSAPAAPAARSLDTIISACLRGRGVIRSLLYFARKDLQEERHLDLNELVREMSQLLGHTTSKRIQLRLELAEGLGWLRGDPGALSHALMNLCVNAIDAMPGGGTLSVRTQADEGGGITLRVEDTGEGMPPEVLAKAMDPFFTTKPLGKGTGLGLGMVYGTMKAHEGTFELRSEPGRGTEAILRLPASRVAASAPEAPPEPALALQTGRPLNILLVDDDELIRESTVPLLEAIGHKVTEAATGVRAIRLLEDGQEVDLVILDMNMPGLSGAETLPRLLNLRPGLPVIMATGYSDDEVAPLLEGRPSVSAIRKPYSLKEIQMKIHNLNLQPAPETPAC